MNVISLAIWTLEKNCFIVYSGLIVCFIAFTLYHKNKLEEYYGEAAKKEKLARTGTGGKARDFPDDADDDPDLLVPAIPEDTPQVPYRPPRRSNDEVLQRSREYYELMAERRTVRSFSPEPIPQEVLDNLIKTAGPMTRDTYVIVIQVHSNVFHLTQLLESMKKASGIFKALLIFSHDYWDKEINKLIKSVQFAKYIQIFYPYSLQLYPKSFPGEDGKLCIDDTFCKNSTLRSSKASQNKLHWWWLANQVFDNMPITNNCYNSFLFLDASNYVTEDFLYTYKTLEVAKLLHCPYCEFISLAAHRPLGTYQYHKVQDTAVVEVWTDAMPKTGLAFNRQIWNTVKTWSKDFCYFNDSRWDRSLVHNLKYRKWVGSGNKDLYVLAARGPRVFNLDKCEVDGCNVLVEVRKFIEAISKDLFPRTLLVGLKKAKGINFSEPAGDWLDYRDRELCMQFTRQSIWY